MQLPPVMWEHLLLMSSLDHFSQLLPISCFFFMRVCFHLLCALICVHVCANIGCANTSAHPRVCRSLYSVFVLLCGRSSLDVGPLRPWIYFRSQKKDLIQITQLVLVYAVVNKDKINNTLVWGKKQDSYYHITNNIITPLCWIINYVVECELISFTLFLVSIDHL